MLLVPSFWSSRRAVYCFWSMPACQYLVWHIFQSAAGTLGGVETIFLCPPSGNLGNPPPSSGCPIWRLPISLRHRSPPFAGGVTPPSKLGCSWSCPVSWCRSRLVLSNWTLKDLARSKCDHLDTSFWNDLISIILMGRHDYCVGQLPWQEWLLSTAPHPYKMASIFKTC